MARRRMMGTMFLKGSTLGVIGMAMLAMALGNAGCAVFVEAPPPPPVPPPLGPGAPVTPPSTGPAAPTTSTTSTGPGAPTTSPSPTSTLPSGRLTKWTTSTIEGEAYDPTSTAAIVFVTVYPAPPVPGSAAQNVPVTVLASRTDVSGITNQGHGFRFTNGPGGATGDTFNVGDVVQVVVASDTQATDGNLIHNLPAGRSNLMGTPTLVADGAPSTTSTTATTTTTR